MYFEACDAPVHPFRSAPSLSFKVRITNLYGTINKTYIFSVLQQFHGYV